MHNGIHTQQAPCINCKFIPPPPLPIEKPWICFDCKTQVQRKQEVLDNLPHCSATSVDFQYRCNLLEPKRGKTYFCYYCGFVTISTTQDPAGSMLNCGQNRLLSDEDIHQRHAAHKADCIGISVSKQRIIEIPQKPSIGKRQATFGSWPHDDRLPSGFLAKEGFIHSPTEEVPDRIVCVECGFPLGRFTNEYLSKSYVKQRHGASDICSIATGMASDDEDDFNLDDFGDFGPPVPPTRDFFQF